MATKTSLQSGDTVRLSVAAHKGRSLTAIRDGRKDHKTARLISTWDEGAWRVDRDLGGAIYWNAEDLVRVKRA